jgi:hypothetical protein
MIQLLGLDWSVYLLMTIAHFIHIRILYQNVTAPLLQLLNGCIGSFSGKRVCSCKKEFFFSCLDTFCMVC